MLMFLIKQHLKIEMFWFFEMTDSTSPMFRPKVALNLGLTSFQNLWWSAEILLGLVVVRVGD